MFDTNEAEIIRIISSLKNSNSHGWNDKTSIKLKACKETIAILILGTPYKYNKVLFS